MCAHTIVLEVTGYSLCVWGREREREREKRKNVAIIKIKASSWHLFPRPFQPLQGLKRCQENNPLNRNWKLRQRVGTSDLFLSRGSNPFDSSPLFIPVMYRSSIGIFSSSSYSHSLLQRIGRVIVQEFVPYFFRFLLFDHPRVNARALLFPFRVLGFTIYPSLSFTPTDRPSKQPTNRYSLLLFVSFFFHLFRSVNFVSRSSYSAHSLYPTPLKFSNFVTKDMRSIMETNLVSSCAKINLTVIDINLEIKKYVLWLMFLRNECANFDRSKRTIILRCRNNIGKGRKPRLFVVSFKSINQMAALMNTGK